ncbi:MAG: hypothetical protein DWQ42_06385 [Planctomycetota bacterium]|nr:MAG: hypothetical protein DWQ42_06385 [Planctomycetota bacterium]REK40348.1 MAG: hypothetical protein DWQ46_16615 [Planctomycetota bacterium]
MNAGAPHKNLRALSEIFFNSEAEIGRFESVEAAALPGHYRRLLDHQEHMTVAVEAYHESLVDVDVLASQSTETHYARRILLRRRDSGEVVQWGLMRIHLPSFAEEVRREIAEEQRPLGRILVRHNFLRTIHVDALWRIEPGPELCQQFDLAGGSNAETPPTTYGRTADIHINGQSAVEVLEVVAPLR